jgi:hypothetical protein
MDGVEWSKGHLKRYAHKASFKRAHIGEKAMLGIKAAKISGVKIV